MGPREVVQQNIRVEITVSQEIFGLVGTTRELSLHILLKFLELLGQPIGGFDVILL
jgi:hypothetical protein